MVLTSAPSVCALSLASAPCPPELFSDPCFWRPGRPPSPLLHSHLLHDDGQGDRPQAAFPTSAPTWPRCGAARRLLSTVLGGYAVRMRFPHISLPRPTLVSFLFVLWSSFLQYILRFSLPSYLIISYFTVLYVLLRPSFFTIFRLYSLVT